MHPSACHFVLVESVEMTQVQRRRTEKKETTRLAKEEQRNEKKQAVNLASMSKFPRQEDYQLAFISIFQILHHDAYAVVVSSRTNQPS
jgi:hypothetical protein